MGLKSKMGLVVVVAVMLLGVAKLNRDFQQKPIPPDFKTKEFEMVALSRNFLSWSAEITIKALPGEVKVLRSGEPTGGRCVQPCTFSKKNRLIRALAKSVIVPKIREEVFINRIKLVDEKGEVISVLENW